MSTRKAMNLAMALFTLCSIWQISKSGHFKWMYFNSILSAATFAFIVEAERDTFYRTRRINFTHLFLFIAIMTGGIGIYDYFNVK